MTNYEWLKSLEEQGKLKPLLKSGIITPTINNYFSVYKVYEFELRHNKASVAVINTSVSTQFDKQLIYRAINMMKKIAI